MSLQQDQQNLNDILEAAHAAAVEFLKSLPTRPTGRVPQLLPHDVLPEEGSEPCKHLQRSVVSTKLGSRLPLARATWAL